MLHTGNFVQYTDFKKLEGTLITMQDKFGRLFDYVSSIKLMACIVYSRPYMQGRPSTREPMMHIAYSPTKFMYFPLFLQNL